MIREAFENILEGVEFEGSEASFRKLDGLGIVSCDVIFVMEG